MVPINPLIYSPANEIASNDKELSNWANSSLDGGLVLATHLEGAQKSVQEYFQNVVSGFESSIDENYLNQLNQERAKLCEMVFVACQELYGRRNKLAGGLARASGLWSIHAVGDFGKGAGDALRDEEID